MPWNPERKLPWKRLAIFEGMYVALFALFVVMFQSKQLGSALGALAVAVVITTIVIIVCYKFGWDPAFLKSRDELAAVRAERIAARQRARAAKAGKPTPAAERYRPAPTKRTSTGATNRQRRTRSSRKR